MHGIFFTLKSYNHLILPELDLGIKGTADRIEDYVKLIDVLTSKDPDKKIKATAAMENSKNKAVNLDSNPMREQSTGNETTIDLKFCLIYAHRIPALDPKYRGKFSFYLCIICC